MHMELLFCVLCLCGQNPMPAEAPEFPVICMGFLPLNHLMGLMTLVKCLLTGGQTWFIRSTDMSTFFDDMRIIRPTEAIFPPRILNMLHDRFEEQLERLPPAASEAERAKQHQVRIPPVLTFSI